MQKERDKLIEQAVMLAERIVDARFKEMNPIMLTGILQMDGILLGLMMVRIAMADKSYGREWLEEGFDILKKDTLANYDKKMATN